MTMTILGLGVARPVGSIAQDDAAALARDRCCRSPQHARLLDAIYRQSTVRERGSVLIPATNGRTDHGAANGHGRPSHSVAAVAEFYPAPASDPDPCRGPGVADRMAEYMRRAPSLCRRAARAALADAGCDPSEIRQVVLVTCTGFASPGLDIDLIGAVGLDPGVGRTVVGFMGCHGAINGLRVADALAAARPGDAVLLVCVELCSLHFQYGWRPQQVVANALFADGAAAVVARVDEAADGLRVLDTASRVIPHSRDDMTWTIGDHGFEMTLSPRVPDLIRSNVRPWLQSVLAPHGLGIGDVPAWAIHPGGPRIVDAAEAALCLTPEQTWVSREVLAAHGNMSSPTVLFILDALRRSVPASPCVLLAFGPGLTAEAALLVPRGGRVPGDAVQ